MTEQVPQNIPPVPSNLKKIQLDGKRYGGFTLGWDGWTGNPSVPLFWIKQGYAGLHVKGVARKTVIQSRTGSTTLMMSRDVGYVLIEDCIIKNGLAGGKQTAIFGGVDAANDPIHVPYTLHLKNCIVEVDENTVDPDGRPEWLIFLNQGDLVLENVILRSRGSNEHAVYVHGFGKEGVYIIDTVVDGVGAEGFKFTARPQAEYYLDPAKLAMAKHATTDGYHPIDDDKWIVIRNCSVKDWNQPHSWRGGAGMTVQGAGLHVLIENSSFVDFNETKPALAVDDGGIEHFGYGNIAGEDPANKTFTIRGCTFASGPAWYKNVIRFGSLLTAPSPLVARSVLIEDCGIYGENMVVELKEIEANDVIIRDCNTPKTDARASMLGVDVSHEATLNFNGVFRPISQGYI